MSGTPNSPVSWFLTLFSSFNILRTDLLQLHKQSSPNNSPGMSTWHILSVCMYVHTYIHTTNTEHFVKPSPSITCTSYCKVMINKRGRSQGGAHCTPTFALHVHTVTGTAHAECNTTFIKLSTRVHPHFA